MEEWIKKSDAIDAIHTYWIKRFETLPVDRDNNYLIDRYLEHNRALCNHIKSIASADRPQGWVDKAISIIDDMQKEGIIDYEQAWEFRMRARVKGADDVLR